MNDAGAGGARIYIKRAAGIDGRAQTDGRASWRILRGAACNSTGLWHKG